MTNKSRKNMQQTQKRLHPLLVSLCLAAACLLAALPAYICAEDAADTDYANRLFDPARVHTMELRMAEEDWADLSRPLQDRPQQFLRRSHLHEEFYKL